MTALMIASAKVRDPFNNDCAVDRGRLDIVQALLNKASINDVHPVSTTELVYACVLASLDDIVHPVSVSQS